PAARIPDTQYFVKLQFRTHNELLQPPMRDSGRGTAAGFRKKNSRETYGSRFIRRKSATYRGSECSGCQKWSAFRKLIISSRLSTERLSASNARSLSPKPRYRAGRSKTVPCRGAEGPVNFCRISNAS